MDRHFDLDRHVDLRATLRLMALWGGTTWLKVDESGAWYARRTEDGPGTVHIVHRGDHLEARGWGPGGERVLDGIPALVGLDDPGVDTIEPHHEFVAALVKRMPGYRMGRTGDVFPRLVSAALAQKVTGKNSKGALRRLAYWWGERAPGPRDDLRLLPEPRELARIPYYRFHPLGIERHRAELVQRIASRASALQRAAGMSGPDALAHLQKLRGIGPWTAAIVVGGPLGYPDAVPVGDYHLKNTVAFNLVGEPRAEDTRMLELLEPYAGQRGRVVRMIKAGGRGAPRYGPRMEVIDIRDR